nr:hypothetical protein [uncultured Flavobacterium sp.]
MLTKEFESVKENLKPLGLKDFVLPKTEKVQQKNLTISQYSFTKIKEETKLK